MGLGGARTAAQVAKSVAKCGEAGLAPPLRPAPAPAPAPALCVRAPLHCCRRAAAVDTV